MQDRLARVRAWAERRFVETLLASRKRRDAAHRVGVTPTDWRELLDRQYGRCSICLGKYRWALEPDFAPNGYLRGLLCQSCQHGMAHFREDATRLRRAAMYLEEKPGQRRLPFRR